MSKYFQTTVTVDDVQLEMIEVRALAVEMKRSEDWIEIAQDHCTRRDEAEARVRELEASLTTATALLDYAANVMQGGAHKEWFHRYRACLANQPAAPAPTCGLGLCGTVTECADCGRAPGKAPARTEACEWGPHCPACRVMARLSNGFKPEH
jgi:hypothetical protein